MDKWFFASSCRSRLLVQVLVKSLVDSQIRGFGLQLHQAWVSPRLRVQLRLVFRIDFTNAVLLDIDEVRTGIGSKRIISLWGCFSSGSIWFFFWGLLPLVGDWSRCPEVT